MNKAYYIFRLTRPLNVLLTGISVSVGYWFVTGTILSADNLFAMISAMSICAGGNVFNDYFDVDIDRINRPERPFPSGKLAGIHLVLSGSLFISSGIAVSFLLNAACIFIAVSVSILLLFYNRYLKRTVLAGNIVVSVISGTTFLYGSSAAGKLYGAVVPAVFAFLYHFGREILKDIEDIEGDRKCGLTTFPIKYGDHLSKILISAIYFLLILLTFYPYFYLGYSTLYLLAVVCAVDLYLIVTISIFLFRKDKRSLGFLSTLLKAGMLAGIAVLLLK